jgi:hypothetical protein
MHRAVTPDAERTWASNPGHYTGYTWAVRWDPVTRLLYSLEGAECVIRSLHEGGRVLVAPPASLPRCLRACVRACALADMFSALAVGTCT